jgi:hypothetical protein
VAKTNRQADDARTRSHTFRSSDILITPLDQFGSKVGKDPVWEDKKDERLVWVS